MKPDYNLIRKAIQLAWEKDPANRAEYAKAKWELDKAMTHKPALLERLTDARDEVWDIYESLVLNERNLEADLEAAGSYLQRAIDEQYAYENREDDTALDEYYDNKRRERNEWQ